MVDRGGRLKAHGLQVELFADVEDLVGRQALRIGRQAEHLDTAITGLDRLDPFGAVGGQVGAGQPAADALEIGLDPVGDRPVIEGGAAALCDQPQGAAQMGIGEHLPDPGRAAGRGVDGPAVVVLLDDRGRPVEAGHVALKVIRDDLRHRHARLAQLGDGQQHVLPRQLAVALVRAPPGVNRAGDVDGDRAVSGQIAVHGPRPRRLQRQAARAVARAVEADDLSLFRVPQHAEGVAADAVRGRLQEPQGRIDGDGRVDGRAAAPQGVDADQGGRRMGRRRRPVRAPDGGASHEPRTGDAVADADAGVRVRPGRRWRGLRRPTRRWRPVLGPRDARSGDQGARGQGGQKGATAHEGLLKATLATLGPARRL